MKNKKEKRTMLFLLVLLAITVGYALLSQQLNINGTAKIDKTTWKIIWNNVQVTEGSVTGDQVIQEPTIDTNKTTVEYSINLKQPKDFYEFTVDAVNEGTIDGMINVISNKIYESDGVTEKELPSYIKYTVTYGDNVELEQNHLLKSEKAETYKVLVEFKDVDDPSELPQNDEILKFKFNVDYIQADENATEKGQSPFTTNLSLEGLSVISYDIDYDKCVEETSSWYDTEETAQTYCRGEDIDDNGTTHNIKQDISYDTSYFEENGIIKNLKYGKLESYEINYEGCKNYLENNGETNEEQVELYCTGSTAIIFGEEQNIEQQIENNPEVAAEYEYYGIINAAYTEEGLNKVITGYDIDAPKNLVIPSEIDGSTIIGIAESAFEGKGIKSVTLPDTIEFVEQDAFFDNDLINVNIGNNNPDIRDCAFDDKSKIENHNLPEAYKCKKIFWALQDNNNDDVNETLVLSSKKLSGNMSGRFNENESFASSYDVPWIGSDYYDSDTRSYNVIKVEIKESISPISTANWFNGVGYNASSFSANLKKLDTSNVTNMSNMFASAGRNATTWNIGNLSNWDTSQVRYMNSMFESAGYKANSWSIGNLSNWDTSKVKNMYGMFYDAGYSATTWDIGNLSNWNTSKVTNMSSMFSKAGYNATTWDIGDLSNWDTSQVTTMSYMFVAAGKNATTWDIGNLSSWDTSKVTKMECMFDSAGYNATTWNIGDLSEWDTSQVTNMLYMFEYAGYSATTFNLNLSGWNTSQVANMGDMFRNAGYKATTFSLTIPLTNGNGINNTTSRMYGKTTSTYASRPNGRSFTLASN